MADSRAAWPATSTAERQLGATCLFAAPPPRSWGARGGTAMAEDLDGYLKMEERKDGPVPGSLR
jgi:hypothetical protein